MTRPRSFGARAKKEIQLGAMRGIDRAAHALDAPISPDSGEMRLLQIDEVRVDPNNPRRLNITWELMQQPLDQIESPQLRDELEAILGLAQTFRKVGQRSPIEVVRDGQVKRIVFGERRYWAARVAELSVIKAIVLRSPPENVPLVQLIENVQHRKMPLYETVLNLRLIIEREAELGAAIQDVTDLMQRTGLTRATAYRYWRCIDLPHDVEEFLNSGTLRSHDEIAAVMRHATPTDRKLAVERYLAGGSLAESVTKTETHSQASHRTRGRPRTTISFGSTKSVRVARHLFTTLDPNGDYDNFDWEDIASVSNVWKRLLKRLEERMESDG